MEDSADMQAPRGAKPGPTGGETPSPADFGRMYLDEQQQTFGYAPAGPPVGAVAPGEPFRAGRYVILNHVGHGAMGGIGRHRRSPLAVTWLAPGAGGLNAADMA